MRALSSLLALLVMSALILSGIDPMQARQNAATRIAVDTPPTTEPVSLAVSADGNRIAFIGDYKGTPRLWVGTLSTGVSRPFEGTDDVSNALPSWSPDGRSLVYAGGGRLKIIDLESGSIRVLSDIGEAKGHAWNADGTIIYGRNDTVVLHRLAATGQTGGVAAQVSGATLSAPHFLPDGRHFLFYATGGSVFVGDLNGTSPKRLLAADSGAVYHPAGYVLFVRGGTLLAQRFDATLMEVRGEPIQVAQQAIVYKYVPALATSAAGDLVYRTAADAGSGMMQFKWVDRSGFELATVGNPMPQTGSAIALSPDGQHLTLSQTHDGNTDVWALELASGRTTRLTSHSALDITPTFSADSKSVYFTSNRTAGLHLYRKSLDNQQPETLLFNPAVFGRAVDASSDGQWLVAANVNGSTWSNFAARLGASGPQSIPLTLPATSRWMQFSPDGQWLAFESNQSGRYEIYLQPFPSGRPVKVSREGGAHVRWNPNGRELFYIAPNGALMAVPVTFSADGQSAQIGTSSALFTPPIVRNVAEGTRGQQYAVSDDGLRFLIATVPTVNSPIQVIRNWSPGP